jgi:hypothetical protein
VGEDGGEEEEVLERKTRAKPGAGTGIVHPLLTQLIVVTLRVPRKRPSTVKSSPRVCLKRKNTLRIDFFLCMGIFCLPGQPM